LTYVTVSPGSVIVVVDFQVRVRCNVETMTIGLGVIVKTLVTVTAGAEMCGVVVGRWDVDTNELHE
jgi:hypothetical protein